MGGRLHPGSPASLEQSAGSPASERLMRRKPRQIILISQWFPPEQAPIGFMIRELANDLAGAGWDVTVVTGFPNHPTGIVFGGYRKRWLLEEYVEGVRVWRVNLYTSRRRTPLRRVLTFLSFTLSSCLTIALRARPDVVFAVLQPLSVGVTLPMLKWLKGFRLVLNVQDLHPDVPIQLGLVRNPLLIRVLRAVERFAYRHADRLAVICDGFRRHCIERGARKEAVRVIPNWVDLDEIHPGASRTAFRASLGLGEDHFVVLYAGTIGYVSGAEVMVEVARVLGKDSRIRVVFVGEGPLTSVLERAVKNANLENVIFVPFQPRDRLNDVQAAADISVVTLLPGKGKLSVPSKVLGYMAAARCVACAVDADSETAHLVSEARCGVVTAPGDPDALAGAILALKADGSRRDEMARNGRAYLERHLSRHTVTRQYISLFDDALANP